MAGLIETSEKYLAGCIMQGSASTMDIINQCNSKFCESDDFKAILEASNHLSIKSLPIDNSTLTDALNRLFGHNRMVSALMFVESQFGSESWKYHLDNWKEFVAVKQMRNVLKDVLNNKSLTSSEMLEKIDTCTDIKKNDYGDFRNLDDVAKNITSDNSHARIKTDWQTLNEYGILNKGEMLVVAGRAGMGKSAFVNSLILSANSGSGCRSVIFSFEMDAESVIQRLISVKTQIPFKKIENYKYLTKDEKERFTLALDDIKSSKLRIYDNGIATLGQIRAMVKRQLDVDKARYGTIPEIIVFDFMQLITSKGNNENERISEISRHLKMIAQEFKVCVIALSQLNRKTDDNEESIPTLSNLRGSGSIEQDANRVVFVHRPLYYKNPKERDDYYKSFGYDEEVNVIVAKSRNGATGGFRMKFNAPTMRFFE